MIDSLRRRLYPLSFVDEFGPVYAVYTLWFNDNGITTSQISTLFLVWAVIALVLEIPSGALADRVDRRKLLGAAFAIRAVGIGTWLVWPTLPGVFIGAALWATHDALASGSWEAMIHDQLTAVDAADRYGPVMARIGQFSNLGVAAGTVVGAVLLRFGVEIVVLGWLTIAAHGATIAVVTSLPDTRPVLNAGQSDQTTAAPTGAFAAWWTTMGAGLAEAGRSGVLLRLIGLGAVLEGLFLIDEYVPLLTRARGGSDQAAPILVLVVWIGLLVGGEVAARRPDLPGRALGPALIVAMAVTAMAFVGDMVWTLALVAIGYAVLETAWITTDARLQERTSDTSRATVTSVRGFGSACVSMVMLAVIAIMSNGDDPTPGLFVMVAALAAAGALLPRWLPRARPEPAGAGR